MVTPCLRAQSGLPSSVVNVLSFNAGGKCIKVEKEASPGADPLQAGELVRAWGEVTSGARVECRLGQFIESQSLARCLCRTGNTLVKGQEENRSPRRRLNGSVCAGGSEGCRH